MDENKISKRTIFRLLLSILAIAAILGVFYLTAYLLGWTRLTQEELQAFVSETGATAPLIFIVISFLQVTFVPIPSSVTIIAGSYIFGFWPSFLYSYIGIVIGSLFAFLLGRALGRPFVYWAFGGKDEAERYIKRLKGKETVVLFFMFLLPAFPDDALCSLAGILPITMLKFTVIQLLTRVTTILGTLFFMSGEIIPYSGWGLAIIIAVAIISIIAFIICFKNAEKINAAFDKFTERVSKRLTGGKEIADTDIDTENIPADKGENKD